MNYGGVGEFDGGGLGVDGDGEDDSVDEVECGGDCVDVGGG